MRTPRTLTLSTLCITLALALVHPRPAAADATSTTKPTTTNRKKNKRKPPEPNAPERYESVVVGKRLPEAAAFAERSVSVVGPRALTERAPRTVPEALLEAPGVFVQQTNHGGGSPIIRGMIGPQNLILLDGVRLNNSVYRTGPTQYLNLIDPLSIDADRGAARARLGALRLRRHGRRDPGGVAGPGQLPGARRPRRRRTGAAALRLGQRRQDRPPAPEHGSRRPLHARRLHLQGPRRPLRRPRRGGAALLRLRPTGPPWPV